MRVGRQLADGVYVDKCKAMHIGSRNKQFSYMMKGHQLDVVTTEKDLGVVISSNLKVAEHCYDAYPYYA